MILLYTKMGFDGSIQRHPFHFKFCCLSISRAIQVICAIIMNILII